jgi:hypothetical protein
MVGMDGLEPSTTQSSTAEGCINPASHLGTPEKIV